jgi:hypothetical protein
VEKGLSQQLAWFELLSNEHQELEVECSASVISRLELKKYLRDYWKGKRIDVVPQPFEKQDLHQWLEESNYFGELWEKAEEHLQDKKWFEQWSEEQIEKVIRDLEKHVVSLHDTLAK